MRGTKLVTSPVLSLCLRRPICQGLGRSGRPSHTEVLWPCYKIKQYSGRQFPLTLSWGTSGFGPCGSLVGRINTTRAAILECETGQQLPTILGQCCWETLLPTVFGPLGVLVTRQLHCNCKFEAWGSSDFYMGLGIHKPPILELVLPCHPSVPLCHSRASSSGSPKHISTLLKALVGHVEFSEYWHSVKRLAPNCTFLYFKLN